MQNADYAQRAVELGHGIISTMEHGTPGNYIEGYNLAKQYNLKFVFGAEAYWVNDRTQPDSANCHIYLGARNENGRQCINDILSEASLTGFYTRPRVDPSLILSLPPKDVIITTACVAFWKYPDVDQFVKALADRFPGNFFLEVQYHVTEKQRELNRRILGLHESLRIPLIMGCDSHYIFPQGMGERDDFLKSKGLNYDEDEESWFTDYPDGDTAVSRFEYQGVLSSSQIDEAISNTNTFLSVEEYDSPVFNSSLKMPTLPECESWTQAQKDELYEHTVWAGWNAYKDRVPSECHQEYEREIQSEIDTVKECRMADYFNINHRVIERGKELGGVLTKTGRGSAVSFITNMLLGFTEVDRIAAKVKMYPARFMSAERILASGSLPDIDFNVADPAPFAKAQQEILGEDHAYPMLSYHPMKASKAWKMYAKSQGVPFETANAVSEQIRAYEEAVKQADDDMKDDIDPLDYIDPQYHEVFEGSKRYRGITESWSIAPCAYLLYSGSIRREIGLIRIKDHICCMMDGHWAEAGHFLKNDLLKVAVVDLIYKVFRRLGQEPPTVTELLAMCPPDDPVWDVYAKGCCMGVNQVERKGTASRVAVYMPKNISELCAFIAAIRPGFKSLYKTFESRKPFEYGVKAFDDLLKTEEMPNAFCLYQEQEMAALHYAGIPMAQCYAAIKDIAKKRAEKVMAYKEAFINGFKRSMIEQEGQAEQAASEIAEKLWQIIEDSSRYSFNASHSYCVSLDSLYIAWAKAHHPLELYETLLRLYDARSEKDKLAEAKVEAKRFFGIHFPPIQYGQDNRQITAVPEKHAITASISSIKDFPVSTGDALYASLPPPPTFVETLLRLNELGVKAKIEPLIQLDYFSMYGNQRELLRIWEVFKLMKGGEAKQLSREAIDGTPYEEPVRRHATWMLKSGGEAKRYTLTDPIAIMLEIEQVVKASGLSDLSVVAKAKSFCEIMGYWGYVSGREEDRPVLYVKEIYPVKRKRDGKQFGYSILTQSLGSGKYSRFTVFNDVYRPDPIRKGDVICCTGYRCDGPYFVMQSYRHLDNYS